MHGDNMIDFIKQMFNKLKKEPELPDDNSVHGYIFDFAVSGKEKEDYGTIVLRMGTINANTKFYYFCRKAITEDKSELDEVLCVYKIPIKNVKTNRYTKPEIVFNYEEKELTKSDLVIATLTQDN